MQIPGLNLDVDADEVPWRPTQVPGVDWLLLHGERDRDKREGAPTTALIRMAPGHGYPAHRHLAGEDVLVLAGGYADELGEYRAGDHVRYPAGSSHAPVALGDPARPAGLGNPACVLYAVASGGIEPL